MAHVHTVSDADARGRLARSFAAARRRAGRVYEIVRTMSLAPPVLDASMALYRQVMHGPSPVSRFRRELLATVVSRANRCHY